MLSEALSFVIAATWVSMATLVAERLGTRMGGVIATLPSTLVVALYFMAVEEGVGFATDVAALVPAEMAINTVFLALFIAFSRRGLPTALSAALGGWTLLSAILYLSDPEGLWPSMVVFVAAAAGTTLWLRRRHPTPQVAGRHVSYTATEVSFRGLFAGAIIALSVLLASVSGPVIGAILSVFPAIFTSTMVILYLRQGPEFTGATGSTMILGSVNVVGYSAVLVYALPAFGAVWGTLLALAMSYAWSIGVYALVAKALL